MAPEKTAEKPVAAAPAPTRVAVKISEPTAEPAKVAMKLPLQVISPVDVARLVRELDSIDEQLLQLSLRQGSESPDKAAETKLPSASRLLNQTVEVNQLNLLHPEDRQRLKQFLADLHEHAPVLHISFSADPNGEFMQKLLTWLRKEIHPLVLVTVGLQPNIGAGCMLRTTNKYFDLSLQKSLAKSRDKLLEALSASPKPPAALAPATAPESGSIKMAEAPAA